MFCRFTFGVLTGIGRWCRRSAPWQGCIPQSLTSHGTLTTSGSPPPSTQYPSNTTMWVSYLSFPLMSSSEFIEFVENFRKKSTRTYNLLCKKPEYYRRARKAQFIKKILKLTIIHASVIYEIFQMFLNSLNVCFIYGKLHLRVFFLKEMLHA